MSILTVDGWASLPGLVHGFFSCPCAGRKGYPIDWLTEIEAERIPPLTLVLPRQVHGARIRTVTGPASFQTEADGLLTTTAGVAVGVTTADCVPVLFIAPAARLAAAVHAGWRGVVAGIVPQAVRKIEAHAGVQPCELRVGIGPAIGACCYEVGPDVCAAFEKSYGQDFSAPAFSSLGTKFSLDLRLFVRHQLETEGVLPGAIQVVGPCTACDPAYASYRRDGPRAGRQLSFVGWL